MTQNPVYKAIGRKSIQASMTPQDLMSETPVLAQTWMAQVLTLCPQAFPGVLGESLMGRALQEGLWQLETFDLRWFGVGRHANVDDTPAGGGAGMVMRPDVLGEALDVAQAKQRAPLPILYLSPRGPRMDQTLMHKLASGPGVTLLCGRFEGIDERVISHYSIQEVSLGDFILTGGELAAQALIDASVRLIPGVLGNFESTQHESFSHGLLEHPQYTKPAMWRGLEIPEVLRSGHHGRIEQWRRAQSEALTQDRRPDLWASFQREQEGE